MLHTFHFAYSFHIAHYNFMLHMYNPSRQKPLLLKYLQTSAIEVFARILTASFVLTVWRYRSIYLSKYLSIDLSVYSCIYSARIPAACFVLSISRYTRICTPTPITYVHSIKAKYANVCMCMNGYLCTACVYFG
jgi:hypothetical protein